ncbi:putative T7SS-secreted protein [Streptomyces sp. NPDC099050]|uniref:putative T7SS-secreted protein n=1 Tax=Streptomyces sp. NPDC099050 TaxID=3366100 RepID=UPI003823A659
MTAGQAVGRSRAAGGRWPVLVAYGGGRAPERVSAGARPVWDPGHGRGAAADAFRERFATHPAGWFHASDERALTAAPARPRRGPARPEPRTPR